jgi:hypothetical protein
MVTTGCGNNTGLSGLVPAGGVVYSGGVPLADALISFYPSSADGRTAIALSDSNGKFTMTTLNVNDGVFPDDYRITVVLMSSDATLPQKYSVATTSGLSAALSGRGDRDIRLELSARN